MRTHYEKESSNRTSPRTQAREPLNNLVQPLKSGHVPTKWKNDVLATHGFHTPNSVYMVCRFAHFRASLPDSTPSHSGNPWDFNGLASMLPRVGVLYRFRVSSIVSFLTGCQRDSSRPCRLGSGQGRRSFCASAAKSAACAG